MDSRMETSLGERPEMLTTLGGRSTGGLNPKTATPKSLGQWPANITRVPSKTGSSMQISSGRVAPQIIPCPPGMPELKAYTHMLCCRAVIKRTSKDVRQKRTIVIFKEDKRFSLFVVKGIEIFRDINVCNFFQSYPHCSL